MWSPGPQALLCAAVFVSVCGRSSAASKNWLDDCTFSPSAGNATSMECKFKTRETIIRQSMLYSIQSLRISRGKIVYVDRDALDNFMHLRNIHITGIEILGIRKSSMISMTKPGAIYLTIVNVDLVTFDSGAFSDWRNPGSEISLKDIGQVQIFDQAFASNSTFQSVSIENVPALRMNNGSFQANIGRLRLKNVSVVLCPSDTFTGGIRSLSLVSVSMSKMESGCIQGRAGWQSLTVRSSHLGRLASSAVRGTIGEVLIEGSEVTDVATGGFDLEVHRFSINTCDVGDLAENALKVRANQSISLHTSRIATLQRHALRSLRLRSNSHLRRSRSQRPQICISALTVNHAKEGSLEFSDAAAVALYGRVCPPEAAQAGGQTQCVGENSAARVSLDEFRSRCCADGGDGSPACPNYGWVPYVAAAAVLLLVGGVALLVYRRRLRAKQWSVARREHQPRVRMVPSVGVLDCADSDCRTPDGGGKPSDDAAETGVVGSASDTGPLASWLQTLRNTVSQDPEEVCTDYETAPRCASASAGSDTDSAFHEDVAFTASKESNEAPEQVCRDVQHFSQEGVQKSDAGREVGRQVGACQELHGHDRKKKGESVSKSHKAAHSTETAQSPPVYAQAQKHKTLSKNGERNHQAMASVAAAVNIQSSRSTLTGNDYDTSSTSNAASAELNSYAVIKGSASDEKPATGGQTHPNSEYPVYADVLGALSEPSTAKPGTACRRESTMESPFYAEVYHALPTSKDRDADLNTRPAEECAAYDEVYDDLPAPLKDSGSGLKRMSLTDCPLYVEGYEEAPIGGKRGTVHCTREATEFLLYAEVTDEGSVTRNHRTLPRKGFSNGDDSPTTRKYGTVPRKSYLYDEIPGGDRSTGSCHTTPRTSDLYAEVYEGRPFSKGRGEVPRRGKTSQLPLNTEAFARSPTSNRSNANTKAGNWLSMKYLSHKGSGGKTGTK